MLPSLSSCSRACLPWYACTSVLKTTTSILSMMFSLLISLVLLIAFLECNAHAIRKPFKMLGRGHPRSSIGSQIREVRDGVRALVLKLYLLMFIDRILDSKVDGGIPSKAAAPDGPDTRPPASASAESIMHRSSATDLRKEWCLAGSMGSDACGR